MSSRLFQEIREKRGLVYYVRTMTEITPQTSLFAIDAGFSPDKIHEFVPALKEEMMTITKYINDEEMNRVINQFEAHMEMQREKSSYRVGSNISDLMLFGRIIDDDYLINNIIKQISKQEVMDIMAEVLFGEPTLAVYGDVKKENENILMSGF